MKINEYLAQLSRYLTSLTEEERERTLDYYREHLADLMEDGMSEEEAVATLPQPFALAGALLSDMRTSEESAPQATGQADMLSVSAPAEATEPIPTPPPAPPSDAQQKQERNALIAFLLIISFPLWFSILLTVYFLILSVFITVWTVLISLWSLVVCLFALTLLIPGSVVAFITDGAITGLLCLGGGLSCLGLGLLSALGMGALTKYTAKFTAWSMKLMFGWMIPKKKKEVRA